MPLFPDRKDHPTADKEPSAAREQAYPASDERLSSWKEIAGFLGRDPRTVQRWEKTEGLPIHRHRHQKLDSIYAFKAELVEWQRSRKAVSVAGEMERQSSPLVADAEERRPDAARKRRLPNWWLAGALVVAVAGLIFVFARYVRTPSERNGVGGEYNPVPLATDQGDEYAPSFSPDGRKVAFVWNGPTKENFDIYVKDIASRALARVTTDPAMDFSPVWSPDGRRIAFCRQQENGESAIYTMDAAGGSEKKIADLEGITSPNSRDLSWSPDGRWLAVAGTPRNAQPKRHGLYAVETASGLSRQVTFPGKDEEDLFPSFSWSGSRLAFTRDAGRGVSENFVVQLNRDMSPAGEPAPVLKGTAFRGYFCGYPVWTPDNAEIVFSSNRGSQYRFWYVSIADAGDAEAHVLGSLGTDIHMPAISREGQLSYVHNLSHWGIWKIDVQALRSGVRTEPRLAVASTRQEDSPKVSPDGTKLLFMSNRSGFNEIWESNLDGSGAVQITSLGSVGVGSPVWSPDGKRIAFDSRVSGKPNIYILDAHGGGKPFQVTSGKAANVIPSWSTDGRSLFFSSSRSGTDNLWRVAIDGGAAEQITKGGGFGGVPSPDGRFLYYMKSRAQVSELWRVYLPSKEESFVAKGVIERGFAPTNDGAYFFYRDAHQRPVLRYYAADLGRSKELMTLNDPIQLNPGLSPDGKTLYYGQLDQNGHDLMMVEKFWRAE